MLGLDPSIHGLNVDPRVEPEGDDGVVRGDDRVVKGDDGECDRVMVV